MPNSYRLQTKMCPKNPSLPLGMCPPKRDFQPHPRSLSKETLKEMAFERLIPRDNTQTDFKFSNVTQDKPKTSPNSFRPTGGVKPIKTITKLTPEQLDKGKLVAASYELNEHVKNGESLEAVMNNYGQNELDNLGLNEYKINKTLSTDQYIVVKKGNQTKVVLRGKDGNNAIDGDHLWDTVTGQARDYSELDKVMETIMETTPKENIEIVSYSNGGPKGLYISEKYNVQHYSIDPVLGPKEVKLLVTKKPNTSKLQIVRTIKPALASGPGTTAQQMITGNANSTEIINVEPIKYDGVNPLLSIEDAHYLHHYTMADDGERGTADIISKNIAGSVIAGVVPAALASVAVENIAPEQTREAKIGETALATSVLTKAVSPLVGAGGAAMSTTLLPIYASFEAADKVGQLTNKILPDDLQGIPRASIIGGVSGGTGGLAYGTTSAAQAGFVDTVIPTVTTAVKSVFAPAATEGVTEGVELIEPVVEEEAELAVEEVAEVAVETAVTDGIELVAPALAEAVVEEVGIEAAITAGAAAGGVATSEFGPLALGGAVVGAGLGAVAYEMQANKPVVIEGGDLPELPKEYTQKFYEAENKQIQRASNQQLAQELFRTLPVSQRQGNLKLNVDRDAQGNVVSASLGEAQAPLYKFNPAGMADTPAQPPTPAPKPTQQVT